MIISSWRLSLRCISNGTDLAESTERSLEESATENSRLLSGSRASQYCVRISIRPANGNNSLAKNMLEGKFDTACTRTYMAYDKYLEIFPLSWADLDYHELTSRPRANALYLKILHLLFPGSNKENWLKTSRFAYLHKRIAKICKFTESTHRALFIGRSGTGGKLYLRGYLQVQCSIGGLDVEFDNREWIDIEIPVVDNAANFGWALTIGTDFIDFDSETLACLSKTAPIKPLVVVDQLSSGKLKWEELLNVMTPAQIMEGQYAMREHNAAKTRPTELVPGSCITAT